MVEVVHLKDGNFDDEIGKGALVLVDFWAEWCAPCRIIDPVVKELAGEYEGRLVCGKLNVDENPLTAAKFQVMSIPTLLLFKDGEIVDKVIGAVPKSKLEAMIAPHLD